MMTGMRAATAAYLMAWRIHSSMPGRGLGAAPSALPMLSVAPGTPAFALAIATTVGRVFRVRPSHNDGEQGRNSGFAEVLRVGVAG